MSEIVISIITSVCSLLGVIVTVIAGNKSTNKKLKDQSELTLYRLGQLEAKQDKHNNVIERTYHLEEKVSVIEEKLKVANNRISDLEHGHP